jgi:prephenate dehydratase
MIYTLGPAGTFSDKASALVGQQLAGGLARSFLPNISSVFDRTMQEEGAIGVVPIENSVAGTVQVVQDLLARHAVWIEHEVLVPVAFKLLVRGRMDEVRQVFVHPVAERQCAEALRDHVAGAEVVFTDSNTDSAVRLLDARHEAAAVVPVDYREPPEAALTAVCLRTAPHNATRFIAIQRAPADPQPAFTREKMSMVITPRANRPGVLYQILGCFQRNKMNLTRIESRPAGGPWEYVFFLDATISPTTPQAWRELSQGDWDVRLLGCYSVLRAT